MGKSNTHDFSPSTINLLADCAGHKCSNPECRRTTTGSSKMGGKKINLGEAAHITAAAPRGPRYNAKLSPEERSSYDNGIWLCSACAAMIDKDEEYYTVELLRKWKAEAEKFSNECVTNTQGVESWGHEGKEYVNIFNELVQRYDIIAFLHEDPTIYVSSNLVASVDCFVIDVQIMILEPYINFQKENEYRAVRNFAEKINAYSFFLSCNMQPAGEKGFVPIKKMREEFKKYEEEIKKYKSNLDNSYQKINDGNSIYVF